MAAPTIWIDRLFVTMSPPKRLRFAASPSLRGTTAGTGTLRRRAVQKVLKISNRGARPRTRKVQRKAAALCRRQGESRWAEGYRDGERAKGDGERAGVEPGVAGKLIEDPAAGQRADRHSECREHVGRAERRAHDARAEVLPNQNRVKRHDAPIGEAEEHRHEIQARDVVDEIVED